MGQGSTLRIINNSNHQLKSNGMSSYQMEHWVDNFPDVINANSTQDVYVEFKEYFTLDTCDDSAYTVYSIDGTNDTFTIRASFANCYRHIYVDWSNTMHDASIFPQNTSGSIQNLGWQHDGITTLKFPPDHY